MTAALSAHSGETVRHPDGSVEFTCLDYVTDAAGKRVLAWTTWLINSGALAERRCIRIEVLP